MTAPNVTESNFPAFAVSAINVNSFNLSTYKEGGCKTLEKLVAIMRRKSDIIIITDCRLNPLVLRRYIMRQGGPLGYESMERRERYRGEPNLPGGRHL